MCFYKALEYAKYMDDPSVLSLPDQFSCEMSTIPGYRERLKAMVFQIHFHEKTAEIIPVSRHWYINCWTVACITH